MVGISHHFDSAILYAARMHSTLKATFVAFLTSCIAHHAAAAPPGAARDFDGDGFDDLAIGAPAEDLGAIGDAGAAHVLYGSANRLTAQGDQFWHQNKSGIDDAGEQNDDFGSAFAIGDFNGDGFSDLAIGAPGESLEEVPVAVAGIVHVLYGNATGLLSAGSQVFSQDTSGISDFAEENDEFGSALAAGDFDGDGFDDLAIGVKGETLSGFERAGAVHILYGGPTGLSTGREQIWHRNRNGIPDDPALADAFGRAIAAGDFDDDGFFDLAIGVGADDPDSIGNAGSVHVLYGTASGLRAGSSQLWHQDVQGVLERAEAFDFFSDAMVAGDFNGDGFDDLAIAAVGETIDGLQGAGAVHILFGSNGGLTATGDQLWHQGSEGIAGDAEGSDFFGFSLASGDFNNDGFDDLAIGVMQDTVGGIDNAGSVHVLLGSADGLTAAGAKFFSQASNGIATDPQSGEQFGLALSAGDFDGDGFCDLAIAAPAEDTLGIVNGGAIHVLYGAPNGLKSSGSQFLHQNVTGIADAVEVNDFFGRALSN